MLKKGFAFVLLILALSPFTAPFQAHSSDHQQIASIEPLWAIRQSADLRTLTTRRFTEPHRLGTVTAIAELMAILPSTALAGVVTSRWRPHASTGDYFALATVLRL
jgi:hypothetical protein